MSKNIKVLHTEWSDGWGGQEIRIINEMIAVREQGIDVYLACRDHAQIKQKAIENNIKVFTLAFRGNLDFSTIFGLKKIINENDINIVNTHSGKDTWVGGFAAKLARAKFIRTRHLSNPIGTSRFNFINELADFVFTTGESVRVNMIENNRIKPESIMSIPTGIDEYVFDPSKYDRQKERKNFGIDEDEIAVGIIAVLRQFKRHDLFVYAAKDIIEQNKNKKIKFIIAGDGPQKKNIKNLISKLGLEENIIMIGHVTKVPQLLMALDIFALTSDSKEGVPQSVMQALLMNKKVLATNAGSTNDLYKDENFILTETGILEEIIGGLKALIDDKSDKCTKSRNFIIENFSKNIMVKKIIKIYEILKEEN